MAGYLKKAKLETTMVTRSADNDTHSLLGPDLYKGSMPASAYGLDQLTTGGSAFSGIAHGVHQRKMIQNQLNDGVDDQVFFIMYDQFNNPVTTPYQIAGKMYVPDVKGKVRISDEGKMKRREAIRKYQQDRIDYLIQRILKGGDETAAYLFGMSLATWKNKWCAPGYPTIADSGENPKEPLIDDELRKLKCSVAYISSLPPGATQTQSITKLRILVGMHEKSVHIEGLSNAVDDKKNVVDGHNNAANAPASLADITAFNRVDDSLLGAPKGATAAGAVKDDP